MSKQRFYAITALVLLGSNLFLLWLHFYGSRPRHEGPRREIIKRLNLDDVQVQRYDVLIKQHRTSLRQLDSTVRMQRRTLYTGIGGALAAQHKDSMLREVSKAQLELEQLHYRHFLDIRALCKPEQVPAFEALSRDLAAMFGPVKPGKQGQRP
jgi:hypothetical protein